MSLCTNCEYQENCSNAGIVCPERRREMNEEREAPNEVEEQSYAAAG